MTNSMSESSFFRHFIIILESLSDGYGGSRVLSLYFESDRTECETRAITVGKNIFHSIGPIGDVKTRSSRDSVGSGAGAEAAGGTERVDRR